ncbi:MAG: hypothetical protein KGD64_12450 [Candidatus Heimdallarchaeota archaeon]|nr:hypothetical protein [Candidatus Heimdallarchaeota archaeon]
MPEMIHLRFAWDKDDKIETRRNHELGEIISVLFAFFYYLLYMFGISGGVYPYLQSADLQFMGRVSGIVNILGFVANRWWLICVLFIVFLCLTSILTFIITKTRPDKFRVYNQFLKEDLKSIGIFDKILIITKDVIIIALYSLLIFILAELIVMAVSTILFSFFLTNLISNITTQSFGLVYIIFLVVNISVFPLLIFLYSYQSGRRLKIKSETDIKDFLRGDGEVDMEKWKAKTWGKKPYSYDWEKDDYVAITCFSCGSIISSNFSECPICNADLLKEIEEIDTEYSVEDIDENTDQTLI